MIKIIENIKTKLEIRFWKKVKKVIYKNYGPFCETKDNVDFPDLPKELMGESRCGSCVAEEVSKWVDKQIEYLEWDLMGD